MTRLATTGLDIEEKVLDVAVGGVNIGMQIIMICISSERAGMRGSQAVTGKRLSSHSLHQ